MNQRANANFANPHQLIFFIMCRCLTSLIYQWRLSYYKDYYSCHVNIVQHKAQLRVYFYNVS